MDLESAFADSLRFHVPQDHKYDAVTILTTWLGAFFGKPTPIIMLPNVVIE